MVFNNLCILVLWTKVALGLKGLTLPVQGLLSTRAQGRNSYQPLEISESEIPKGKTSRIPSNDEATFIQSTKTQKLFENYLIPVMLVFIGKLSLSTLLLVPMCQGFSHSSGILYHFVLAKLATSSIWVKLS